jgi:membrane-associated phospholipid phosphatase
MKKNITLSPLNTSFMLAILLAVAITLYIGVSSNAFLGFATQNFFWNTFLINITFMGDAFFALGLFFFLLIFLKKKRLSLILLIAVFFCLAITQFIKNIFSGVSPQLFFEAGIVAPSNNIGSSNIISSHTAIAFTLAIFFAMHIKKMLVKVLLFLLAVSVAISRIILAEESLMALLVGLLPAIVVLYYLYQRKYKSSISSNTSYYYENKKERKSLSQQFLRV